MCGRYALNTTAPELMQHFQLVRDILFPPRFNIAPTSEVPVIRQNPQGERVADLLKWGLIPHWAKDPGIGAKLNNARSETVAEKPSFCSSYKSRRCLVPASGFYEWKATPSGKQPYFIHYKDSSPLAMGGLWESWIDPDGVIVRTFCVLTTGPNEVMQPIHDRMPVLIQQGDFGRWLNPEEVPGVELAELLAPAGAGAMEAWPVSNARNEGVELMEPLADSMD